jgi:hypothetical protein
MKSNNEEVTHSGVEYVEKIETVFLPLSSSATSLQRLFIFRG